MALQEKQKRAKWTESKLKEAMESVSNGTMSVNKAASSFKIPRRTLRNHLKSGSTVRKLGRQTYLSAGEENELCQRIFRMCDIGMPLTPKILRRSVFNYCSMNNIPHPFDPSKAMAGRKWLKRFLKRHPEVANRKAQSMNPSRAIKLNPFIVNDHFQKLRDIMIENQLMDRPELIYNIDEKGVRLTIHHQQNVLARRGAKRVHLVAPEHAENVTIVTCANAIGSAIPPMVLFKGQRLKPEWYNNMPTGTVIYMCGKGSMTTVLFIRWLEHFARYKVAGKALLIFDGAASHLDANITRAAEEHGIILYCLPSNTTHELQPLDKSVFKSFESCWDDELLLEYDRNKNFKLNRSNLGSILSKVWARSVTARNIMSGFRATGIYPFDPHVIPEEAFAPSAVTEAPQEAVADSSHEGLWTPDNSSKGNERKITQQSGVQGSTESDSGECSSGQKNTSFTELLTTPKLKRSTHANRKKSLNYRGQRVVTSLFKDNEINKKTISKEINKNKSITKTGVSKKIQKSELPSNRKKLTADSCVDPTTSGASLPKENWYCSICEMDEVADMILCTSCLKYFHEKCVSFNKRNKMWKCPECLDSD